MCLGRFNVDTKQSDFGLIDGYQALSVFVKLLSRPGGGKEPLTSTLVMASNVSRSVLACFLVKFKASRPTAGHVGDCFPSHM